ncbi:MAG: helix-turn-helix transcriptional regulator [Chloroflexota bacterium]
MQHNLRRETLAEFLQSRRARLSPADVGLTSGRRRRTPGLRREEVAQLAGVGLTWYTWLEQGRNISVSEQVVESIANALQLDQYETRYLFTLSHPQLPYEISAESREVISPAMHTLLGNQGEFPAFILGRYWDILAWNQSASLLLGNLETMPIEERNQVWLMFVSPVIRQCLVNWQQQSQRMIAEFRVSYGHYMEDAKFGELVARLMNASEEFRVAWNRHEVIERRNLCKEFEHPVVGRLSFEQTTLLLSESPDHKLVVKIPMPETDTHERLKGLLATASLSNR